MTVTGEGVHLSVGKDHHVTICRGHLRQHLVTLAYPLLLGIGLFKEHKVGLCL